MRGMVHSTVVHLQCFTMGYGRTVRRDRRAIVTDHSKVGVLLHPAAHITRIEREPRRLCSQALWTLLRRREGVHIAKAEEMNTLKSPATTRLISTCWWN
jgi:hypothetical protein